MSDLNQQQRTAIESVAKRFSATWENGSNPCDAYIIVAGKQVAVDITTLNGVALSELTPPSLG